MTIPNVWGQGQLFAFSALDGELNAAEDFCGTLLGDAYGVRFHSNVPRELRLTGLRGKNPHFDAVTSDCLCLSFENEPPLIILYAAPRLIIGTCTDTVRPKVFVDGPCFHYTDVGEEIQDTGDGFKSALGIDDGRFAFAYGEDEQEVLEMVGDGLDLDPKALLAERCARYTALPEDGHALLRAKCLSVMKTQVYSPCAEFKVHWSTPDRYPHHHLWLWDSVFHAVGFRHVDPHLAEELILSVFTHQAQNGFIPHMADVDTVSSVTQPPIIAWGALKVYEKSGNKEFLETVFDRNSFFLSWFSEYRLYTPSDRNLYTWNMTADPNCRCDESGMDNSPRFDGVGRLYALDASCFMANEVRSMAKIARILGNSAAEEFCMGWYEEIAADIDQYLWSEEEGFYFDRRIQTDELSPVRAVSSFLPLWAGIARGERAEKLVRALTDPATFGTPLPVPSVALNDPTFGTDMWRGPVWINYNYLICEGLREAGYGALADEIRDKTVASAEHFYRERGVIYEFYDPLGLRAPCLLNRKGTPFEPYDPDIRYQAIRDYGWSSTLLYDWLN